MLQNLSAQTKIRTKVGGVLAVSSGFFLPLDKPFTRSAVASHCEWVRSESHHTFKQSTTAHCLSPVSKLVVVLLVAKPLVDNISVGVSGIFFLSVVIGELAGSFGRRLDNLWRERLKLSDSLVFEKLLCFWSCFKFVNNLVVLFGIQQQAGGCQKLARAQLLKGTSWVGRIKTALTCELDVIVNAVADLLLRIVCRENGLKLAQSLVHRLLFVRGKLNELSYLLAEPANHCITQFFKRRTQLAVVFGQLLDGADGIARAFVLEMVDVEPFHLLEFGEQHRQCAGIKGSGIGVDTVTQQLWIYGRGVVRDFNLRVACAVFVSGGKQIATLHGCATSFIDLVFR